MSIFTAKWISEKNGCESPVFRKKFIAGKVKSAVADVCGLGWFELYVNGQPVSKNVFEPAVSTYGNLNGKYTQYPIRDVFNSPRVYFCRYDITELLEEGENVLAMHLGNGWFNQYRVLNEGSFQIGTPRLAFCVTFETADGRIIEIESDTCVMAGRSHIIENNIYYGEKQDLHLFGDFYSLDFSERDFSAAVPTEPPEGKLTLFDFGPERVSQEMRPVFLGAVGGKKFYDAGEVITGRVRFDTNYSGKIRFEFAEELTDEGLLDFSTVGNEWVPWRVQTFECIADAIEHRNVYPHFVWYAFRYFSVEGEVENLSCEVIHTDLPVTSVFRCGNNILNKLYEIYIRTQQNNVHGCVPSDCPHRERLGYTGDGQITCASVMMMFDARKMYKKWMQDIVDCQDISSGHVQHTAPFFGGGGGPAGWGGAMIVVPYQYYKIYGDDELMWDF